MDRLFYSLNPTAGTTLSTLPFAENRRRLTLNAFHDALKRLDRSDTSLNMASETRQGEWEKHLRRLGLEPDLFAVQQAMNVDEGDAAEAFKTTTGRQFVEWLLSKALDTEKYGDLGDTFGAYAKKIGQREQMLLEREFSTAMAEAAQKLATCRAEQVSTTTAAQAAETTLGRVASEIQVSVQKSEEELARYRSELETTKTTLHERQQRRDHADARNKEVIRRTLALRVDNASSRAMEIGQSLTDKRAELDAWRLIPKVLEANTAHEKYRVTSELLDQAERAAGAAQLLRDRAGAQLAGALQHAEQRCRQQANELADSEVNDKAAAAKADRAASTCEQHATKNSVTVQHLTAQVEDVQTRVEQAREAGLLENDETVPDADARLRSNAEEGAAKAARLRDAHTHLELEIRQLGEAANQLIEPEITARKAAEEAATAVSKLDTAARELAAEQLVRELAELNHDEGVPGGDAALWIETNAPMLRGHAEAIQASTRDQLDALNADNKTDQRLIDALTVDDDALLPPRETVEHLLQLLSEHGVDATPGWRALEQVVNPRLHGEAIQANPALLDGIVVTDETQLVTAQEVLTEARPLPGAAILVTTAESLGNGPAATGAGFVVEPTPAMHDPAAATELRSDVEARMADRNVTIADLAERHAHAQQLRDRLDTWIRDHPAGDVERLRSAAETAAADATDAKVALDAAHEAHTQSVSAFDEHVIVLKDAEAAAVDAVNIAASMTQLAADLVEADQCRRQITELDAQTNQYRNDAGERRQQAEALRNQATESAVQAESYRRDAAVYVQRLKTVVVGNEVPNADVDDGDLTALEIAYENAVAGFQAVEVGEDLRQRVDTAQSEMSIADAALQDEPTHIVASARLLTGTSEAGNEESREAAKRRLGRAVAALETEHETLTREIGRLQGETTAASPPGETQWANLDAEWTPSNLDHGAALAERAAAALNDAQADLDAADGAHQSAAAQLARAQASTREMQLIHGSLQNTVRKLDLPSDVKPFTGTAKDAQRAVDEATRAYAEASERLGEANQGVHEAVAGFRDAANQNRFAELKAPVYKQLTDIDKTALIERSDQWATQLAARAASLTTDLEDSERHRQLLIDQLQHHVGEALAWWRRQSGFPAFPTQPENGLGTRS
ncbi:hypothetical protein BJF85_25405 [Saccharomonospora sp. CUA-673]|uniref:hypothetical protein n=1 Tax=Saccharomonospora sp. CUA-673 TaxID=1904969 RepID=UPI00096077AF|nr:hypothetical protein [Saccharomonospora sp. CUA-673]OLT40092.1 hypothetical protein BJF85_25405 [Saccharomonospora sp. CUA-673]